MKSWPAAILERYPVRVGYHGQVPTRPWWSGSLRPGGTLFRLPGEDGIKVEWRAGGPARSHAYVQFPPNGGRRFNVIYGPHEHLFSSISTFEGAVADFGENYDATMPMDTEADVLALLERLDRERPLPHPGYRVGQIWADGEGVAENGGYDPIRYRFLVADLACPHLAPWSPS